MPAPTVYRSTDISAPAWAGTSSAQDRAKYMLNVLKACLVDGYPGKPAAGWALVGHDTAMPQLAIKNASETGAVRLTYQSNVVFQSVYQSMSAIDEGVGGVSADYVVSSQGLCAQGSPPEFHWSGGLPWVVVADGDTAVMFWWAPGAYSDFTNTVTLGNRFGMFFAGRAMMSTGAALDGAALGNFVAGPGVPLSTGGQWTLQGQASIAARPDGSVNAPALTGNLPISMGSRFQDWGAEYLVPAVISQAAPADGSTLNSVYNRAIGHLRGIWVSVLDGAHYYRWALETGALVPGDVITLAGRPMMFVTAAAGSGASPAFVSLDPADWT